MKNHMRYVRTFVCAALCWSLAATGPAGDLKLGQKGVEIHAGNMGNFTLAYPSIKADGDAKPMEARVEDGVATVKYPGDIALHVSLEKGGRIALRFSGDVAKLKSFRVGELMIPFNYADGGMWKVGDSEAKPFPPQKPEKPHLYQGNASTFEFANVDGKKIRITVPDHSYQQLQDNREWGWKIFAWWFSSPFNKDHPAHYITVEFDASDVKVTKLVDRFGQTTRKDFPGKIANEGELKADAATEAEYYTSLTPPTRNAFGGLPGSGEKLGLKKTGFFHVEKKGDRWILVDPQGDAFFHLGICSFGYTEDYTYIEGRESTYEWLPPHDDTWGAAWKEDTWWNSRAVSFFKANLIRKYGTFDNDACISRMIDRIRAFGFNSIGAFSGSPLYEAKEIPYVAHLPLGLPEVPGVRGVFDPFSEANVIKVDANFAKSVAPRADRPLLIGWFLANEQGMEDIPRAIPKLDGKHACKRRLVQMLQEKYDDIASFNAAWEMNAASFEALVDQGLPLTTKKAFEDMQAYNELFLNAYYKLITETFRKYDPNHMLIGNRWQPGTANSETLCRVAGQYMDIISINYYASGIDAAFVRRLYDWTGGRPQMWSEFYYTGEQESNVSGSGMDVGTQRNRGLAYRQYVEGAAALGFVVGVEWFTLIDQAVTGRFFEKYNGERNNTGLFNVLDRPYKPMIEEMMKTHEVLYDVWLDGNTPFTFDHPRFSRKGDSRQVVAAGHATGPMQIDGQLDGWPGRPPMRIGGDRLVSGRENYGVEAAFKLCWDEEALYLLANVTDPTPMQNTLDGGSLWNADAIELFIGSEKLDQGGAFLFTDRQILIGAGKANQTHVTNTSSQPKIESAVAPSVDGKGYTIEAAIPWSALAIEAPKEGMELLFDIGIDDCEDGKGRRAQLMWNGIARNSSDRGAWGRLKLER